MATMRSISICWEGGQSRTVVQVRYIRVREGERREKGGAAFFC